VTTLVWDASCLFYAARADRLDVLADYAAGPHGSRWCNVTTQAVVDELSGHGLAVGALSWLDVVHVDGLGELTSLLAWMERHGAGEHHRGEATVCAWADAHGATAVLDDRNARKVAATYGLAVHGSLWVLAQGVVNGRASLASAANFVDILLAEGARYGLEKGEFPAWCRENDLLPR
jgi:predicted nucleic acid-binding protein